MNTSARNAPLPACPVETTLTLISDKWKVLILRDLMSGTKRFGELKRSIGHVTQKVLTAQLRQMEQSGLLTRAVYAEVPPRVEYTLTELGRGVPGPGSGAEQFGIRKCNFPLTWSALQVLCCHAEGRCQGAAPGR